VCKCEVDPTENRALCKNQCIPSVYDSNIIIGSRFCYFIPLVSVLFINVRSGFAIKSEF
jgi:hypothetical protein